MFSKILVIFLLIFLSITPMVRGQTQDQPPAPNLNGWKKVNSNLIDISSESGIVIYLGYEDEYQNPDSPNEFVRVSYRFVSFVSIPVSPTAQTPYIDIANNYLENMRDKAIEEMVSGESDPFLYVQWRTSIDAQTGRTILDGPVQSWLLAPTGDWVYRSGVSVSIKDVSEPVKNQPQKFIQVGRIYSLDSTKHVLRVDQDYFATLRKRG